MSKAFTKEDDAAPDELPDEPSLLPDGAKNYMTPAGAARIRSELAQNQLSKPTPEIARRRRYLEKQIERLEIVEPGHQPTQLVLFGATVNLRGESGSERTYRIVGIDEADVARGLVSWISPIAKALLNRKVGDVIMLRSPAGPEDFEIVQISY